MIRPWRVVLPFMLAAIAGLCMNAAADLRPIELCCEYRVNPLGIDQLRPRLSWALESQERCRGVIRSRWEREKDRLHVEIQVPPGTTATLQMPASEPAAVWEGGQPAATAEGVSLARGRRGLVDFRVVSGRYRFESHGLGPAGPAAQH